MWNLGNGTWPLIELMCFRFVYLVLVVVLCGFSTRSVNWFVCTELLEIFFYFPIKQIC